MNVSSEGSQCPIKRNEKRKNKSKAFSGFPRAKTRHFVKQEAGKVLGLLLGVLLVTSLFILPSVYASLGNFKTYDCVDIKTILNTTNVNISSINAPNSATLLSNIQMTKTGFTFNYTFCNTSVIGVYNYDYFDAQGNVYVNDFTISPSGTDLTTSQSIIYFIFLAAATGIFFLCLYFAIRIPWRNDRDEDGMVIRVNDLKYVKLALSVFCYVVLIFIFGILREITMNFTPEIGIYKFFEWGYLILISLVYPIVIAGLLFALMIFLTNRKLQKAIERGIPVE